MIFAGQGRARLGKHYFRYHDLPTPFSIKQAPERLLHTIRYASAVDLSLAFGMKVKRVFRGVAQKHSVGIFYSAARNTRL